MRSNIIWCVSEEKDWYVVLCWDEVKEGLVFDKHSCELIGFTNLGDINNDLNRLEEECQSTPAGSDIASCTFVYGTFVYGAWSV